MNWLKHWSSRTIIAIAMVVILAGLATSFPADIAFLMALDLSTWVEAMVAVYVVAQVTKIRPILTFVRARLFGWRSSKRHVRTQQSRGDAAADDDPAPLWALAA